MKVQYKILENVKKVNQIEEGIFFDKKPKITGRDMTTDKFYQRQIVNNLFPMLDEYGIVMLNRPIKSSPSILKYLGRDEKDVRVTLVFMNNNDKVDNYGDGDNSMFVNVGYNHIEKEAGLVDLTTDEGIDSAFELITMTIEDIANSSKQEEKQAEEKKETSKSSLEDFDSDIDNLINFKNSN